MAPWGALFRSRSYGETGWFSRRARLPFFKLYPATLLRLLVLKSFDKSAVETRIRRSIDFMVGELDAMDRQQLASRLQLNCTADEVDGVGLEDGNVTLMSVLDSNAVPDELQNDLAKRYPRARVCDMKDGGAFPYLSRAPEMAALITLHLRKYEEQVDELDELLAL